jgi:hypothetical protein
MYPSFPERAGALADTWTAQLSRQPAASRGALRVRGMT